MRTWKKVVRGTFSRRLRSPSEGVGEARLDEEGPRVVLDRLGDAEVKPQAEPIAHLQSGAEAGAEHVAVWLARVSVVELIEQASRHRHAIGQRVARAEPDSRVGCEGSVGR